MNAIPRFFLCLVSLLAVFGNAMAEDRPVRPNVVLILADDLGWQDVKCYDVDAPTPMETPNIDALARGGIRFKQAYAGGPVCTSS